MRGYTLIEILVFVSIAVVILAIPVSCTAQSFNDTVVTATVEKKESVSSKDSHTYLFFTDKGVFENDDNLLRGKWNSSDFYNEIKEGKTYKFTLIGWRVPFLSWYKNIIKYEEVK